MADDFQGDNYILLQPGDLNVPVKFRFVAATASTANDGSMPYGSTIVSSSMAAYRQDGTVITSKLIAETVISGNTVIAYLQYNSTLADGEYYLTVKPTFSLVGSTRNMTKEFDFARVHVRKSP